MFYFLINNRKSCHGVQSKSTLQS